MRSLLLLSTLHLVVYILIASVLHPRIPTQSPTRKRCSRRSLLQSAYNRSLHCILASEATVHPALLRPLICLEPALLAKRVTTVSQHILLPNNSSHPSTSSSRPLAGRSLHTVVYMPTSCMQLVQAEYDAALGGQPHAFMSCLVPRWPQPASGVHERPAGRVELRRARQAQNLKLRSSTSRPHLATSRAPPLALRTTVHYSRL